MDEKNSGHKSRPGIYARDVRLGTPGHWRA